MRCEGSKEKSPKRMHHPSDTARGRKSVEVMRKSVKTCGLHPQMVKHKAECRDLTRMEPEDQHKPTG